MTHSGNIAFRHMVQEHKERFRLGSRKEKSKLIDEVVAKWREQDPPGRFVTKRKLSNGDVVWYECDDEAAKKRAAKSLAEWTPPSSQGSIQKRERSDGSSESDTSSQIKRQRRTSINGKLAFLETNAVNHRNAPSNSCCCLSTGSLDGVSTHAGLHVDQRLVCFSPPTMGSPSAEDVTSSQLNLGQHFNQQQQLSYIPQMPPAMSQGLLQHQAEPQSSVSLSNDQLREAAFHHGQLHSEPSAFPEDDIIETHLLSNSNLAASVDSSTTALPIQRIRMTIPTAAELSADVFSDDERNIPTKSSQERKEGDRALK